MAFGNPVTDGSQVAVGTYGYVVSFDLTLQEPGDVDQVQLQKAGNLMSTPVTAGVDRAALFGYMESSSAPSIAFAQEGNVVFVFLKTSVYTFTNTNRIAFWFQRNAQNIAAVGDKRDFPQEAKELAKAIELRKVYEMSGKRVTFDIARTITSQRAKLGL